MHVTLDGRAHAPSIASAAPPMTAGPVTDNQRIGVLDVLRGFALLGILVLNIEEFSGPSALHDFPMGVALPAFVGWHARLDVLIVTIKWMFFEGKMRTLFSMLFGAGIVLLTERLEARGQGARAGDVFCRRNLWLLLFGILHGTLIWEGDILSQYALVALQFMFPFRRLRPRRLIVLGATLGILGGTLGIVDMVHARQVIATGDLARAGETARATSGHPTSGQLAAMATLRKERVDEPGRIRQEVSQGRLPYLESVAARSQAYFGWVIGLFSTGWILEIVGSMLLGMGLFRCGFLKGEWHVRSYVAVGCACYAVSLSIVAVGMSFVVGSHFAMDAITKWIYVPYQFEVFPGAVANVCVVLVICKRGWLKGPTRLLANVGRTAFSNYIMTSILCQFVFGWGPWKLYGALEYYQEVYVVLGMWAVNLVVSDLWLRAFRFGPLEWVWRSLTYWRLQPMLGDARQASPVPGFR